MNLDSATSEWLDRFKATDDKEKLFSMIDELVDKFKSVELKYIFAQIKSNSDSAQLEKFNSIFKQRKEQYGKVGEDYDAVHKANMSKYLTRNEEALNELGLSDVIKISDCDSKRLVGANESMDLVVEVNFKTKKVEVTRNLNGNSQTQILEFDKNEIQKVVTN